MFNLQGLCQLKKIFLIFDKTILSLWVSVEDGNISKTDKKSPTSNNVNILLTLNSPETSIQ